jgi:hypothetical protein
MLSSTVLIGMVESMPWKEKQLADFTSLPITALVIDVMA